MTTQQQYPKRLIEIDLPIKRISAHARREKSIRHGHISTLHIWWARRPLAACRAVICAALWLDPVDKLCPQMFRDRAANIITEFAKKVDKDLDLLALCDPKSRKKWTILAQAKKPLDVQTIIGTFPLQQYLFDFIADFSNWDCSNVPVFLETARALTQAAHEALDGISGTKPLVVDPFAGGGSIPLEALRVGADAFASDLNPVAVLLNKVVLEYIPKYGTKLAEEVRKWGTCIKEQAEKELVEFYPKDPDGATPIAYLWARTIRCEGPNCGAVVPLLRSLHLAKKDSRSVAMQMIPTKDKETGEKNIEFEIITKSGNRWGVQDDPKQTVMSPKFDGTVNRGNATCPCCGYTTPVARVREQLKAKHGGANDAQLMCVVTTHPNTQGRFYRKPTQADIDVVHAAEKELKKRIKNHKGTLSLVPDEPLPSQGTLGFRVQLYGMTQWYDLFSSRQLLTLTTMSRLTREIVTQLEKQQDKNMVEAIQTCLALAVDRQADYLSSLTRWLNTLEAYSGTFGRQALPMMWDFVETCLFSNSTGCFSGAINWVADVIESNISIKNSGQIIQTSATNQTLPDGAAQGFVSDPPYYDAVPYADLSDFFFVWLKRSVPNFFFKELLTPKNDECIVDEVKGKNKAYFEMTMKKAMAEGRRILSDHGIGIVIFAHKSTAGWESQLQSMIDAGWIITGSWSIDTERPVRLRAQSSAALASSIHLVCRPRVLNEVGEWRDVIAELPKRIHDWMPRLSNEGVVGADAIFACLGPALEIFSRYSSVEKTSGEPVTLREYLELVWGAISKEALSMIFSDVDTVSLEEDARLTSIWLWTLSTTPIHEEGSDKDSEDEVEEETINESKEEDKDEEEESVSMKKTKGFSLEYDAARKIAQGLGVHLEELKDVVEIKGSKARLLTVEERIPFLFKKSFDDMDGSAVKLTKKEQKNLDEKKRYKRSLLDDSGDVLSAEEPSSTSTRQSPIAFSTGETVLDRVHQAMLFFADGRGDALRRFLVDDKIGNSSRFWKLAQSLAALYPTGTNERRWVEGVLARKKGLGF
jgi:adenine-specific DNA methylase